MNISILYFSETGNTERMAGYIAEGIRSVGNAETRLINLAGKNEEDVAFLKESKAVIFGTPTYAASMCWQMKQFFDTDWNCDLAGKLGAVFATANCLHGGADVALLSVIGHLLVKGMVVYSSGAGCGRPFIHLGPVALRDELDEKKDLFMLFGKRVAEKASELFPTA